MEEINIEGINKVNLLREMWKHQRVASFFGGAGINPPTFDETNANNVITKGYIDYFQGRAIKADLSGDTIDPRLYDRDAGRGSLKNIVETLRK